MCAYVPPHLRNKKAGTSSVSSNGGSSSGGSSLRNDRYGSNSSSSFRGRSSGGDSRFGGNNRSGGFQSGGSNSSFGGRSSSSFDRSGDRERGGTYGGFGNRASSSGGSSGGSTAGTGFQSGSAAPKPGFKSRFDTIKAEPAGHESGWSGSGRPNDREEATLFHSAGENTGINFGKYDSIPVETSGNDIPKPVEEFTQENIGELLMANVQRAKFVKPTPVQKYSIPICHAKRDIMACAQTGSGKTAGFLFPTITQMLRNGPAQCVLDNKLGQGRQRMRRVCMPSALILAPTRELAVQIEEEAQKFCYMTRIRPVVVYGGARIKDQFYNVSRGADMLVATPGRLVDMIQRGYIRLEGVRFLVLDEADQMLDMGFIPQIRKIVEDFGMVGKAERQTMMFSATFPHEIQQLASDFLKDDYIFLSVGVVGQAAQDVQQSVELVRNHDKDAFLLSLLSTIEGRVLVFVETKRKADELQWFLQNRDVMANSIHGDRSQGEREYALRGFKDGSRPVLVATSVAARGLDIPKVQYVINYDMPSNIQSYVHRIGRTGRAGNLGRAVSFVNENNANVSRDLCRILEDSGSTPPQWLKDLDRYRRGGRGHHGGNHHGGNRGKFGGRDYRQGGRSGGYGNSGSSFGSRGGDTWAAAPRSAPADAQPVRDNSAW